MRRERCAASQGWLRVAFAVLWAAVSWVSPAFAQTWSVPRDTRILEYPLLVPRVVEAEAFPLVFSNSPEVPREAGVLYRDAVSGLARVMAYHVNGLEVPARLLVVARNVSGGPLSLTTVRRGSAVTARPDPLVGQQTLLRYLSSGPLAPRELQADEGAVLLNVGPLAPGSVVSAMLDVQATAGVELSVLLVGASVRPDPAVLAPFAPLAPDGLHQRGTFPGAVRALGVRVTDLPARLVLGAQGDAALVGVDALTGEPQVLRGNYGVLYDLRIESDRPYLLTSSSRGGSFRGAVWLREGERSSLVLLGAGRAQVDPAVPAPLWRAEGDLRVQFVPGGGSNLPVALVFYPPEVLRRGP